jgi:long-chain acyl-CoA synthetase
MARIPPVLARGRWWPADEIDAWARQWRAATLEAMRDRRQAVGAVLPASPDGVALFAGLTSLPVPLITLPPEPTAWRTDPPIPAGTLVVLPPSLAGLADDVSAIGAVPLLLPDRPAPTAPPIPLLDGPGIVLFTSGSTGVPRPVFRTMSAKLASAASRIEPLGLSPGDGIIAGASLAHGQGQALLLTSFLLGGPFGLLSPIDHRAALEMIARPEFACWWAMPHFADVLGRCAMTAPPVAPRTCLISSAISRETFDAFANRFGVPLRQAYSSTEAGVICVNDEPAADVRHDSVGQPLPGVEIRIGDHPETELPAGEAGRIWVRSAWQMRGYGFPPALDRPGDVDGFWPTRDRGCRRPDGQLILAGRIDDTIRTREGRLINLHSVAAAIARVSGVRDVAVVPLHGGVGVSCGALIESESAVTLGEVRAHLAGVLPSWSQPRAVMLVNELPRLSNGKIDRLACAAALGGA